MFRQLCHQQPRKDWPKLFVGDVRDIVKGHLDILHRTRSKFQFATCAKLVEKEWRLMGENELADTVKAEYFTPPFDSWFSTASGIPGLVPSSNHIEAWNRGTKHDKNVRLRARLDTMLETEFDKLINADFTNLTSPIASFVAGVVPAELVHKAAAYDIKADILEYPLDSGVYYINKGRVKGQKITEARIRKYEASLTEELELKGLTLASFEQSFMSLHKVVALKPPHPGPFPFSCDCKGYYHKVVCSHILAVRELRGEVVLAEEVAPLPKNKRKGRPRKATPALVPQPNDGEQQKPKKSKKRKHTKQGVK